MVYGDVYMVFDITRVKVGGPLTPAPVKGTTAHMDKGGKGPPAGPLEYGIWR